MRIIVPKRSLNLSVDRAVVARARLYCERHETSISQLVEDFLSRLPPSEGHGLTGLPPAVQRLVGVARGADPSAYRKHLIDKFGR